MLTPETEQELRSPSECKTTKTLVDVSADRTICSNVGTLLIADTANSPGITDVDSQRVTAFIANSDSQPQVLDLRHRGRGRCEQRIKDAKDHRGSWGLPRRAPSLVRGEPDLDARRVPRWCTVDLVEVAGCGSCPAVGGAEDCHGHATIRPPAEVPGGEEGPHSCPVMVVVVGPQDRFGPGRSPPL